MTDTLTRPAWPRQDHASMCDFYGDPDANGDGLPDRAWESANLTKIKPPYGMVLAWSVHQPVSTITCHKKVSANLLFILDKIASHYGSQSAIEAARLHLFGGCYSFRLMRGGHTLSIHSWGAAIDLDPEKNPFGTPWNEAHGMMPHAVVDIFEAEKWTWGGQWSTKPDCMHFQCANI